MSRRNTTARARAAVTAIQPAAESSASPAWVSETPEFTFTLEAYHPAINTTDEMVIELTRAEYVALKQRLAELRGIAFDAERAA